MTHWVADATTSLARWRAYSSPPIRPAMLTAATMTRTRMIDTGSPRKRKRRLVFPGSAVSCNGGWCSNGAVAGYSWAGGGGDGYVGGAVGWYGWAGLGVGWVG